MVVELRDWEIASGCVFAYTAVLAASIHGLAPEDRLRALTGSVAGLGAVIMSVLTPPIVVLDGWILPPVLLLLSYRITGLLFTDPMPRTERAFRHVDSVLAIRKASSLTPRPLAEMLECAYAAVYAAIPVALVVQMHARGAADYDRFWTVILITDYICFGLLPWIRTRPPRALEDGEPWRSSIRMFNLRLLGAVSVRVNTFPSGHAAEALAAALLTTAAPAPVPILMLLNALAVSAGAVLGRYHYAVDAVAGWLVAAAVWRAFG
jgi:membrane-associated phospholipid phosphatase